MNRIISESVTSFASSFLADVVQHVLRPLATLLHPRLGAPLFLLLMIMLLAWPRHAARFPTTREGMATALAKQ